MGFVKLNRDLLEWAWYGDNNTLSVYIRLLMEAAWGDYDYQNVHLTRGQIATTLPKIANENDISIQQARTIINRLKSTGKITVEQTSKFRVITLVDYDCAFENSTKNNRISTVNQQAQQQSINSPSLYIKEENKNIRKQENAPAARGGVLTESFEKFWNAYPKKTAKQQALKAWEKLKPDEELLTKILTSLERQKRSVQWTKDNGQFIPYPATWLNGKRWEDETEVQNGKSNSNYKFPKTEEEWLDGFN